MQRTRYASGQLVKRHLAVKAERLAVPSGRLCRFRGLCIYMADVVVTVMIVNGLNKELEQLDQIQASMRVVSNDLTDKLGNGSLKTVQRMQEGRVKAELAQSDLRDRAEEAREMIESKKEEINDRLKALKEKRDALYRRISQNSVFGPRRLIKAFPDLKMPDHEEALQRVKEMLEKAGI